MYKLLVVLAVVFMSACQPVQITDAQVKMIVEQCAQQGYATRIFNSALVSRAECAETITKEK